MPNKFQDAAVTLRRQVGLPDVTKQAGSSPAGGGGDQPIDASPAAPSQPVDPPTPPKQPQPAAEPRSADEIMAMKDKAISDAKSRVEQLEESNQQLLGRMQELVDRIAPGGAGGPPEEPAEEPLPDGFDSLPAPEQVDILAERKARKVVKEEIAKERAGLQRAMSPLLGRVKQTGEFVDRREVEDRYPKFDYDTYKPSLDKLAVEMPALSLDERVRIVVKDPLELTPAEPSLPPIEPSLPSSSAASGGPAPVTPPPVPATQNLSRLLTAAGQAAKEGRNTDSADLVGQILKKKGVVAIPAPFRSAR